MLPISKDEIRRWRIEIEQAEEFRAKEFGEFGELVSGAGRNINYFEQGGNAPSETEGFGPALNLAFPIIKNIVPSLLYQRPRALAFPERRIDSSSAPLAAELLNYYIKVLDLEQTDQQVVWDSYVLGYGVSKIGYATKFGADQTRSEAEQAKHMKEKLREKLDASLASLGLKKPAPQEQEQTPEPNEFIQAEQPYVIWLSPFDFLIDPRARSVHDAQWVAQCCKRTIADIKADKRYGRGRLSLKPDPIDTSLDIPETQLEHFQTADIYEVHYKDESAPYGVRVLWLARYGEQTVALGHENNPYPLGGGWQFELLTLNKHGHRLYPVSDISIIRPLLDRLNSAFDAILEQVDKFVSKIAYNKDTVGPEGETQLRSPTIGGIVAVDGSPREAFYELHLDQLKQDMVNFIDKVIDIIILQVGLTRAQLTGLTTAQTATEAQIGQGGQQIRRADQTNAVVRFGNRQLTKLWTVIANFVDLEEVQLITGETEFDEETGMPRFSWLPEIDPDTADSLRGGQYRFEIEMNSTQKPNMDILRKQLENLANLLMRPEVHQALAMEGHKLSAKELLRVLFSQYPEVIRDPSRIIRQIPQPGAQPPSGAPGIPNPAGQNGSALGILPNQLQEPPINFADLASEAAGEKGQGVPAV